MRYNIAEKGIVERGGESWKDNIRDSVEKVLKREPTSFDEFKFLLEKKYQINVQKRGETLTYTDLKGNKCRANKLGHKYEMGALNYEFKESARQQHHRQVERLEYERNVQTLGRDEADRLRQRGANSVAGRIQRDVQQVQQQATGYVPEPIEPEYEPPKKPGVGGGGGGDGGGGGGAVTPTVDEEQLKRAEQLAEQQAKQLAEQQRLNQQLHEQANQRTKPSIRKQGNRGLWKSGYAKNGATKFKGK